VGLSLNLSGQDLLQEPRLRFADLWKTLCNSADRTMMLSQLEIARLLGPLRHEAAIYQRTPYHFATVGGRGIREIISELFRQVSEAAFHRRDNCATASLDGQAIKDLRQQFCLPLRKEILSLGGQVIGEGWSTNPTLFAPIPNGTFGFELSQVMSDSIKRKPQFRGQISGSKVPRSLQFQQKVSPRAMVGGRQWAICGQVKG